MSSNPKRPKLNLSYQYRERNYDEIPKILDFWKKHFFLRECSLIKYLNRNIVDKFDDEKILEYLRSIYGILLEHLSCFVAVETSNNDIVGVVLLKLEVHPMCEYKYKVFYGLYKENLMKALHTISEKTQPWIYWAVDSPRNLHINGEFFNPFEDSNYADVEFVGKLVNVSVHPEHGTDDGLSIMEEMLKSAIEWAKNKHSVQLIYGLLRSSKATRAAMHLNFIKIREQNYSLERKELGGIEPASIQISTVIRKT